MYKIKKLFPLLVPPIIGIIIKKIFLQNRGEELLFDYENNFYNRVAFIQKAINQFDSNICSYLEIGVNTNTVFYALPLPMQNKIGVDPFLGGTHRMTSDEYFENNKRKFDVIFIDGLHTYEQCQKDLINSLNVLNSDGIILLHDLLPRTNLEAEVPQKQRTWSGDIWKVAVELNSSLNIDFKIINIDRGIGVVKPKKNYKYIKNSELHNQNFNDFYKKYFLRLPIISCEEGFNFIHQNKNV